MTNFLIYLILLLLTINSVPPAMKWKDMQSWQYFYIIMVTILTIPIIRELMGKIIPS